MVQATPGTICKSPRSKAQRMPGLINPVFSATNTKFRR